LAAFLHFDMNTPHNTLVDATLVCARCDSMVASPNPKGCIAAERAGLSAENGG
jgi:hypothetical protein